MKSLNITISNADFDNDAAKEKIIKLLRRRALLSDKFLYRGFPKGRLEYLHKHGLDHPLSEPTFASTAHELTQEDDSVCAIYYALRGGCLAILSKDGLDQCGVYCYKALPSKFPEALIALVLFDGNGVGDEAKGVLEDTEEFDL